MRLTILHDTVYQYETPARYCIQYLRLTPRSDAGQRIAEWDIESPGVLWRQTDAFGNVVHVMSLDAAHQSLRIRARGVVETTLQPGDAIADVASVPVESFLVPTPLTQPDAALTELSRPLAGRVVEDLPREALLDDVAPVEDDDPVPDLAREVHLVRHHDHRDLRARGDPSQLTDEVLAP